VSPQISAEGREHAPVPRSGAGGSAKRLLAATRHLLATLVKTFNEFLFELDAEGKFLHLWSSNAAVLHGRRTEFLERHALEVLGEDTFHPFRAIFRQVIASGESEDIEFPAEMADGPHWFEARVSAVSRERGKTEAVYLLVRDITPRKQAEEKLRKSEALLAQAEQLANMGSWELDPDSKSAFWSENLYRILGADPREFPIPMERVEQSMRPDDAVRVRRNVETAFADGTPFEHDFGFTLQDGRERILHSRGVSIRNAGGRVVRVVGITRDVTEQKATEQKLRKSEALLVQAEQLANMGSWELDADLKQVFWSDNLYPILGAVPREGPILLEQTWRGMSPGDIAKMRGDLENAVARGKPFEHDVRVPGPDGRERILHTRGVPIRNTEGRVVRVVGITRDVTGQKATEQKLRKSEALLAQAEQLAKMGSWELTKNADAAGWSDNLFRILEFAPQEGPVAVERVLERMPADQAAQARELVKQCFGGGKPFEHDCEFRLGDGRVRALHTRGVPIRNAEGRVVRVAGVTYDVTERQEAELKLQKSEALLAQAERLAGMGSWELGADLESSFWSDNLYRIKGVKREGARVPADQIWRGMRPEDVDIGRRNVQTAFASGEAFEHDFPFTLPDGRERVLHARGVPIRDAEGRVVRLAGITLDVTERRRAEEGLRRVSRQLLTLRDEEQRRMARDLHETAAQSMAALKMTLGRLNLTLPKKDAASRKLLRTARELANDAIQQVRTVSYLLHPLLLEEAGLDPALRWFAAGFEERSGIRVKVSLGENFGRLPRDTETAIFRIIQEALTNVHRHSKSRVAAIRLRRADPGVCVEVKDRGVGMALPSAATGLDAPLGIGIAGMRERVKQLGGTFEIESEPGQGTTIRVVLPVEAVNG